MKKEFKNFIKSVKDIKLSETEKLVLRNKISEFISFNPIRDKAYIPGTKNYLSIFEVKYFARATALVLIFGIVAGGSGVSYAASDALPGEKLYNVKVNINEKIEESLAFSTEAKVVVESKQVERRLEETQTLVKENKLSENAKKIVEEKLDEHIQDLTDDINTLKESGKVEVVLETTAKLTPVLEVHKDILEEKDGETESLIAKVEDSIQKVEKEEDAVLAVVSDSKEENLDKNEENTSVMTMSVEQTTSGDIKEESTNEESFSSTETETGDDFIEGLNTEDISKFIQSRIEKTEERITILKSENNILPENQSTTSSTNKLMETKILDKATDVLETKTEEVKEIIPVILESKLPETDQSIKTEKIDTPLEKTITEENKIDTTNNIESKIKEAQEALNAAKEAFANSKYKDSVSFTQKAIKIIGEIEVEQKLKSMDLASQTVDPKDTLPAQVTESIK